MSSTKHIARQAARMEDDLAAYVTKMLKRKFNTAAVRPGGRSFVCLK